MSDEKDADLNEKGSHGPPLARKLLPYAVLAILLALSVAVWRHFENLSAEREQRRFDEYADAKVNSITAWLERYKMVLQGGVGGGIASEEVSRAEWRAYIDYRQIRTLYPGVLGMGFSKVIRPAELARHIQSIRADGFPDYTVWPDGERDEYTAVIFLEPFDARNQRALGYDMFSEPVRRAAMVRARDTGEASMSGRVTLVQEPDQDIEPGFLIYVPVYHHAITPHSPEARRASILGYVYAPFRMRDFMEGIFPEISRKIDFVLYDGADISPAALMYDSRVSPGSPAVRRRPIFTATRTLDLYGQPWTLAFDTTSWFDATVDSATPKVIFGGGIILSLLIFYMLKMLETAAARASSLALKMTAALREGKELNERLAAESRTITCKFDTTGLYTYVSPLIEDVLGYRQEEIVGKLHFYDLHPEEGREAFKADVFSAMQRKEPFVNRDNALVCKDGSVAWVVTNATPILNVDGSLEGYRASDTDITDRLQVEDDLRASEARQRYILSASPTVIYTVRLEDFTITWVSPSVRAMLGYTVEEALEPGWWEEHLHPDDREQAIANDAGVLETGRIEHEYRFIRKDGTVCWVNDRMELQAAADNSEEEIIGAWNDITAYKQSEADRIARQAAEAASREKSRFLANMSHEIRTPMSAILGFAQIIGRDSDLDPAHMKRLRSIDRAGHHLLALINDILDMAKVEAGLTVLSPSAFSLHDLLDDLEIMFRSRADAKGLQLIMERDPGLPFCVLGDHGKLRQILVNLHGNAVKFTQEGGVAVRVRTEPAAEAAGPGGDSGGSVRLIVEVEDSGPGISAADLERIFGSFVQGAVGVEVGGTGLGLSISRKLVEMMGGSLTVQSEIGHGSCFRFDVLLEPTDVLPEDKQPEFRRLVVGLVPGTGPWRILVVDDVQDNRDLLRDLLQSVGFEIREARNGAEALAAFAEWSPHAVLMDMRMPVMDGYEATRRIKDIKAGRDIPVIAVTASAFGASEDKIRRTGVFAYLRKPFHAAEVFGVLGNCLGLRYVYDDEPAETQKQSKTPTLTPESVAALPAELRRAMRDAVADGDTALLAQLLEQTHTIDPSAAAGLKALADRYDYGNLDKLLAGDGHESVEK